MLFEFFVRNAHFILPLKNIPLILFHRPFNANYYAVMACLLNPAIINYQYAFPYPLAHDFSSINSYNNTNCHNLTFMLFRGVQYS